MKLLRPSTYRARALRRRATPAERALWRIVRRHGLDGAKFRRQHPLGPFYVDFYCVEAALVLEADGAGHFPPSAYQHARNAFLASAGVRILRFENSEILDDPRAVVARILAALRESNTPPLPPGEGAGGEGKQGVGYLRTPAMAPISHDD